MAKPNSKAPLGQGGRFAALSKKVGSPALAAYIGRKKYGKKKFQKLATKGRKQSPMMRQKEMARMEKKLGVMN